MNGQQNILLTPLNLMLILALVGEVFTPILPVIALVLVATAMRRLATSSARSGPHFICSPEPWKEIMKYRFQ